MSHEVGLQVSHCLDTQLSAQGAFWSNSERACRPVAQSCKTEREQDTGRAPSARPYSHIDIDPTEILRCTGDRFHQGQERNPYCSNVPWSEEELYRHAFLGTRVLCINCWRRRGNYCQLHQESGRRRQAFGPIDIFDRRMTTTRGGQIIF